MGPSDLEEILRREPEVPVRLTLASGDQIVIRRPMNTMIGVGTLIYTVTTEESRYGNIKFLSIPNITLVERLDPRRPQNGHTRRRRK
jgi:hypothetical protein